MNLDDLTRQNADALPIYREACAVLELPLSERRPRIESHAQRDRLAKEVVRLHARRKQLSATRELKA